MYFYSVNEDGAIEGKFDSEDIANHQSLRVKKVIVHPKWNDEPVYENDIALIQLYPKSEDGQCAIFNNFTQPACLNKRKINNNIRKGKFKNF